MDTKEMLAALAMHKAQSKSDKDQQRFYAKIVGYFALGLPLVLWIGPAVTQWGCRRYSISHFYYSPFYGSIFIGLLTFVGIYLLAYKSQNKDEHYLAKVAGISALGVAYLPTSGHGCLRPNMGEFRARAFLPFKVDEQGHATLNLASQDTGDVILHNPNFFIFYERNLTSFLRIEDLHYICAALLFSVLLYFCFVIFVRADDRHKVDGVHLTTIKKVRNTIYVICGSIIYLSMLQLGLTAWYTEDPSVINTEWNLSRGTFRYEAYALVAFGVSWLVKGRFVPWLVDDSEKDTTAAQQSA